MLIAPTAVLPEGYPRPAGVLDHIGRLMLAHPENALIRPTLDRDGQLVGKTVEDIAQALQPVTGFAAARQWHHVGVGEMTFQSTAVWWFLPVRQDLSSPLSRQWSQ
jgi:hypothetical protein